VGNEGEAEISSKIKNDGSADACHRADRAVVIIVLNPCYIL
jgi:hypothetical protein